MFGGVLVGSVVSQWDPREVCSAKIRQLGEKVGQSWRLQINVPTVKYCLREDAIKIQDVAKLL